MDDKYITDRQKYAALVFGLQIQIQNLGYFFITLQIFEIRNSGKSGIPEIWISRSPDFQNSGKSGNPEIRISGSQDFRKSGYPDIRISEYPDYRYRIHVAGNYFPLQIQISEFSNYFCNVFCGYGMSLLGMTVEQHQPQPSGRYKHLRKQRQATARGFSGNLSLAP